MLISTDGAALRAAPIFFELDLLASAVNHDAMLPCCCPNLERSNKAPSRTDDLAVWDVK